MDFVKALSCLLLVLLAHLTSAAPFPVDLEPQTFHGTIQGSPVVAVLHGASDFQKDDVREKDSEDDPLGSKFGPAFGDHSD